MSMITESIKEPVSKKIYLGEIDITRELEFAVNWRAGCWRLNLDVLYPNDPEIESWYLVGVDAVTITRIGSMRSDGLLLQLVNSTADVQTNELSFYWDQDAKDLYFHLQNGDTWSIHRVTIGEVFGVASEAINWAEFGYQGRLLKFPGIDRDKDPLFFGRLYYPEGRMEINNEDGFFDDFCIGRATVEAVCRVKQGFAGFDYPDFVQTAEGIAEKYSIGPDVFGVDFRDRRSRLEKKIPDAEFDQTTYPDLKDSNVGKGIPIGYGVLRNVPVICTNEAKTPAPANYNFKLFDTTYHAMKEITTVRVEGVVKVPSASDLDEATFSLAAADYSPGDEVRVDCSGYVDALGNLIDNPLDIIRDLLTTYYPINYNNNYFNVGEWEIARAKSRDVNYFANKPVEIEKIIEDICNSTYLCIIPLADGRYTARYYNQYAPTMQVIRREEVLKTPTVEWDSTQMLRYVRVGYDRDWAGDEDDPYKYYTHDSGDERTARSKTFETLLTNKANAIAFAQTVILLTGDEYKPFDVELKLQALEREVMDFIEVEVWRPQKKMLGWVKAEAIGIHQKPESAGMTLNCRAIEILPETIYQSDILYTDDEHVYDGGIYSLAGDYEVT